jgi:hypothetical protein
MGEKCAEPGGTLPSGANPGRPSARSAERKVPANADAGGPLRSPAEARPRGFEPLTFGSVDRRGRARFGSTKPNSGSHVAKKSPEIQNRGHYPPRRAVGWPCGGGRLLVRRAGIRSASRQAPTPRPEQARGGRGLGRSHPGESSRGCVAPASPVRAEAGPARHPASGESGTGPAGGVGPAFVLPRVRLAVGTGVAPICPASASVSPRSPPGS